MKNLKINYIRCAQYLINKYGVRKFIGDQEYFHWADVQHERSVLLYGKDHSLYCPSFKFPIEEKYNSEINCLKSMVLLLQYHWEGHACRKKASPTP